MRAVTAPAAASVPTGSAPAGSAPAGSAPAGSAPAGSAPAGSAPAGSAPPDRALLTSVRNAARVLRAFSRAGQELAITELSPQLGLAKSPLHRLLTPLS